ncbi:MAG: hypothetical protein ACKOQY_03610, partial [Bacteroidota bacterium]
METGTNQPHGSGKNVRLRAVWVDHGIDTVIPAGKETKQTNIATMKNSYKPGSGQEGASGLPKKSILSAGPAARQAKMTLVMLLLGFCSMMNQALAAAEFTISSNPAAASGALTICAGRSVTFTVTSTGDCPSTATPSYQWKINGANASGTSTNSTYTTGSLANYDQVTCVVTWTEPGCGGSPYTSNIITCTVNALPTPQVVGSTT